MHELPIPELPKAAWIDRCTMALGRLKPNAEPEGCKAVAMDLWHDARDLDPEEAAAIECETWADYE
jgi:hypothetical protein